MFWAFLGHNRCAIFYDLLKAGSEMCCHGLSSDIFVLFVFYCLFMVLLSFPSSLVSSAWNMCIYEGAVRKKTAFRLNL